MSENCRALKIANFVESLEETVTKALARLAVIDSRRCISFLLDLLPRPDDIDFGDLPDIEKRMLQMFYVTVRGKADRITGGAEAYTFLGTANYVKHEGLRPMNITWKLDAPIPAKYLKKTNKLVVG